MNGLRLRARQFGGDLVHVFLRRPSPGTLSIVMYHAVTPTPVHDTGQLSISRDLLRAHLAYLREHEFTCLPLEDAVVALGHGTSTRPLVSVVFDDGFVGVHDEAAPVLAEFKVPATVFVVTSWVGRTAMPDGAALGRPLNWREVSALARAGFSIGSHTDTHLRLAWENTDIVARELARSRRIIAEQIGRAPRSFAYPFGTFGTFSARTRRLLSEAGFQCACTTVWGRNRRSSDALALKRMRLSWCDGGGELAKSLVGCYDWYGLVQRAQAARAFRSSAKGVGRPPLTPVVTL